jgi:DNA-binding transcriptional ArsR family regulator
MEDEPSCRHVDTRGNFMITIRLTDEDIAATRVSSRTMPMMEVVLAARRYLNGELWPTDEAPEDAWALLDLIPRDRCAPPFLRRPVPDLDGAVDGVVSTPLPTIRSQLVPRFSREKTPAPVAALLRGEPTARLRLAAGIRAFHDALVHPAATFAQKLYEEHRDQQRKRLADQGLDEVFAEMYPRLRWDHAVLRADSVLDVSLGLTGQGLVLAPSVYADVPHVVLAASEVRATESPIVIYPVPEAGNDGARSLSALLGATRAKVLRALGPAGCSTSVLAQRLGITAASASQHATVLRNAGLVETVREGRGARHKLTPLGFHLLVTNVGRPAARGCTNTA